MMVGATSQLASSFDKTQAETVVVTGNPLFVLEVNLRTVVSVRIMSHERLMSGLFSELSQLARARHV